MRKEQRSRHDFVPAPFGVFRTPGKRREAAKGFNWIVRGCCFGALIRGLENLESPLKRFELLRCVPLRCADLRFAEPRSFLKKVLIVAVRSRHCGELNRGLQNLETSCERNVFRAFRLYEKNQKYTRGLRTSGLRGRFKSPVDVWLLLKQPAFIR